MQMAFSASYDSRENSKRAAVVSLWTLDPVNRMREWWRHCRRMPGRGPFSDIRPVLRAVRFRCQEARRCGRAVHRL